MKDNNCQSEQLGPMQAKELKKFEDCPIEEKIVRLHLIVKDLRRSLEQCYHADSRLATKMYALEHHQHSEKGDCMIRIEDTNRGQGDSIGGGIAMSHDILA